MRKNEIARNEKGPEELRAFFIVLYYLAGVNAAKGAASAMPASAAFFP